MMNEKKTTTIEDSAWQAEQLEEEAKAGSDAGTYTHTPPGTQQCPLA